MVMKHGSSALLFIKVLSPVVSNAQREAKEKTPN